MPEEETNVDLDETHMELKYEDLTDPNRGRVERFCKSIVWDVRSAVNIARGDPKSLINTKASKPVQNIIHVTASTVCITVASVHIFVVHPLLRAFGRDPNHGMSEKNETHSGNKSS